MQKEFASIGQKFANGNEVKNGSEPSAIEKSRIDMNERTIKTLFPDTTETDKNRRVSDLNLKETLILSNSSIIDRTLRGMGLNDKYDEWTNKVLLNRISTGRKGREETIEALKTTATTLEESEESRTHRLMSMLRMGR